MEQNHSGKVALITGSGKRRMGNTIARTLAAKGFDIALHYRSSKEDTDQTTHELSQSGVRCLSYQADLGNEIEVSGLVDRVRREFGRIDVLVTAQGKWSAKPLEDITSSDLLEQFNVDLAATFLCCQKVGLLMTEQETGGSIVTIGDWAIVRPYRQYSAYFAAKGSVPTMTRSLAVEFAARNTQVRVNCILPGPVMAPESLQESEAYYVRDKTLLKRLGKPEHVAHAVLFLVENDFVTGVCLPVDGGRSIAD